VGTRLIRFALLPDVLQDLVTVLFQGEIELAQFIRERQLQLTIVAARALHDFTNSGRLLS